MKFLFASKATERKLRKWESDLFFQLCECDVSKPNKNVTRENAGSNPLLGFELYMCVISVIDVINVCECDCD